MDPDSHSDADPNSDPDSCARTRIRIQQVRRARRDQARGAGRPSFAGARPERVAGGLGRGTAGQSGLEVESRQVDLVVARRVRQSDVERFVRLLAPVRHLPSRFHKPHSELRPAQPTQRAN